MNAKKEFLKHTEGKEVYCVAIEYFEFYGRDSKEFNLPINYSEEDFSNFLDLLDFEYDDGYGSQELFGTIWYKDGTWSDRWEYEGDECWEHKQYPAIPKECMEKEQIDG